MLNFYSLVFLTDQPTNISALLPPPQSPCVLLGLPAAEQTLESSLLAEAVFK